MEEGREEEREGERKNNTHEKVVHMDIWRVMNMKVTSGHRQTQDFSTEKTPENVGSVADLQSLKS